MLRSINAASPSKNYDGITAPHYVIFPIANGSHEINLSCSIRPGALEDSYSVTWYKLAEDSDDEVISNSYVVTVTVNASLPPPRYCCVVNIQHRSDMPDIIVDLRLSLYRNQV